jgi:hypothetical protein
MERSGSQWADHRRRTSDSLGARVLGVELVETLKGTPIPNGHILPNAAWRLVRVLDALLSEAGHIKIPGFYDAVIQPTPRELELSDALPTEEEMYRDVYLASEFVYGRSGKELNRAVFLPTCNIQGITTGYQARGCGHPSPRLLSWTSAWFPIRIRMVSMRCCGNTSTQSAIAM